MPTRELTAGPRIVNADLGYPKARLVEPATLGYLYVGASVQPGPLPLVLPSARRSRLLARLKALAPEFERLDEVVKATVFRAIFKPPASRFSSYLKERGASVHVANFDVIVLIQTTSPETAHQVRTGRTYDALVEAIRSEARGMYVAEARNARRIGDVDTTSQGLFLFNHFAAADPGAMLELWEYLAGWYAAETGLDNSVALVPVDVGRSDYAIINWASWDERPLRHFWRQLSKQSFRSYVIANLEANQAASMPIYCRLA